MDIFNVLSLIGGLCLFLFGMNVMGQALERRAGGKLRSLLGKMTTNRAAGHGTWRDGRDPKFFCHHSHGGGLR